jgi:hypothetical protein
MFLIICIALMMVGSGSSAKAQGIFMGDDGRVHAQAIIGSGGEIFPVLRTPCYAGPCPVLLGPPLPWRHPRFAPSAAPLPLPPPPFYPPASRPAYTPPPPAYASPLRRSPGPSLRSSPPAPVPGAPFERTPEDGDDRGAS